MVDIPHYAGGEFSLDVSDGSIAGKGVALAIAPDQTVDGVRARGLRMVVSTRRKVTVGIELRVSRRTARRLDLPGQVLGRTRGTLQPGQKLPATLRLSAAARQALAHELELRATARLTLLNSSAPNRTLEVPVRLDG